MTDALHAHHAIARAAQSSQREGPRRIQSQYEFQCLREFALRGVGVVGRFHAKRVGA